MGEINPDYLSEIVESISFYGKLLGIGTAARIIGLNATSFCSTLEKLLANIRMSSEIEKGFKNKNRDMLGYYLTKPGRLLAYLTYYTSRRSK